MTRERYFIGPRLLSDIRDTISRVTDIPLGGGYKPPEPRLQDGPPRGEPEGFRLGQITATWTKGNTSEVTRMKTDGTLMGAESTFASNNWMATIDATSSTNAVRVHCCRAGAEWFLVSAECDT